MTSAVKRFLEDTLLTKWHLLNIEDLGRGMASKRDGGSC